ncbi:hypothetical protein AVEN_210961-1 [Araneus ventricosus]|uniref:Uncharacterized protein n=1 Tax=Araneus ventricosus TaxID=182803 RepID=A0A4Y2DGJ1_ARAVE|nr:hypothetical protein AVEN_210961-1 [Araneus ventricosus]
MRLLPWFMMLPLLTNDLVTSLKNGTAESDVDTSVTSRLCNESNASWTPLHLPNDKAIPAVFNKCYVISSKGDIVCVAERFSGALSAKRGDFLDQLIYIMRLASKYLEHSQSIVVEALSGYVILITLYTFLVCLKKATRFIRHVCLLVRFILEKD